MLTQAPAFAMAQQRVINPRPAQPILCFPPRDVPIEDIYSYTIPIPPEYSSGQVTKEYQDWEDSQWIHASNLSKHGDPTRTVVTCPRRSTSGHGDHLSVIVGPLVKQVPQRWPRKMFRHERFTPYPFYAGKDPHARDAEIVTWRKKLRAKAERKDARGRPLTWVQIEPQNDGVMIRWRNRLGVRSRKEEKSHCDVSRKSDDTSPNPKTNLPSPAISPATGESVKAGSHISPSLSPTARRTLLSPCSSLSTSPCSSSVHSSSSTISLQPPSTPTGILSPSLTPSSSAAPSPLLAHPLSPSISGPPSLIIPASIPSSIPTPSPSPSPPPFHHSLTFIKPFAAQSPTVSSEMHQQLTELLAKKDEQLTQWEKLKEEFHNDHHMLKAFDNQIIRLLKEIEEIKQLQRRT
ncbi:hypothetical protein CNBM1470 [Cryptococcus deneoformans B-3501A]|uniref:Uncharacterized protein n=1 Tax=Cryptococcus deneoformans (strain JEC21 / ATCC MYA-565) TaxID=214684 RepID=Q5K7Q7_CRYD1|nr:hypothetical protein CNM01610 [Cryptococcus neoformans var. neoformans JEC21]XP_772101.1 hypothetical protein CNBM1470 [Cryptococcus neoformans var. neoformans B-3501A]AAW46948.1 hypothetical protein CNM01610 [Cryptococcus neoformans var. neoformans JEC21]EAL17454.1 hypothetical protein CNBM1470 [Cryptococcus neoformans var. neoformans B-3501A]